MADVLNTSPSISSTGNSYSFSPSNYEMGRVDYGEEGIFRAFKDLLQLTIPITITSLFVSLLLAFNLIWIGHHSSSTEFAGASLGNMFVNIMGNSIIIGMTSGLDTQCGQAFGARLYGMMGVLVQRSIIISHIFIVFLSILFWFSDDLLIFCGQNSDVSHSSSQFIRIFIASLWPIAMFGNLRRFLQAQRRVIFIPFSVLIGLISQLIFLILFINILSLNYIGACIALPASYWSMTISLYCATKCNKQLRSAINVTWTGWSSASLNDWNIFLSLSIPATLQLCAEWWSLEIMVAVAGYFNNINYISAFTCTLNIIACAARLPLGISFSCAVLVGNKLGARNPHSARIIYDCSVVLSVISGAILGGMLWIFNDEIAKIYTHKTDINHLISDALPYCGVYFFFYSYQRGSAGGSRGMGRQKLGNIIYCATYYLIGLPCGIWFGFKGLPFGSDSKPLHIKGLWIGATISSVIGSFFFLFFRFWINWEKESQRAQQRISDEQRKMIEFKEYVESKYGDMMGDYLLEDDDDFEPNIHNYNIDDDNDDLGKFKLDNTDNELIFDTPPANINDNRNKPVTPQLGYVSRDQSQTRNNSFPSRSFQAPSVNNNIQTSMTGQSNNYADSSLQSDLVL